ncbi:hypothetical protein ACGFSB_10560 [Streptomyces sp. NPDC048441]|uniref:LppU/SCO3897 family protein n=1 Tax=Streptomyces sp. NPDC048441 TaxID=3365552 RepID=UPI003714A925
MSEPITPAPRPSPTPAGSNARGCLASLGAIGAVLVVILLLNQGDDDSDNTASPGQSATSQESSYEPSTSDPYSSDDPYTDAPSTDDPYDTGTGTGTGTETDPVTPPTSEAPSPYTSGTCLNGTLPDSETAQEVSGVDEVSCGASDAHYRVIETIPMTSDMSRCDTNSKTQYAFSYRYTLNGSAINEYVYCLVGLGSYAR